MTPSGFIARVHTLDVAVTRGSGDFPEENLLAISPEVFSSLSLNLT